MDSSRGSSNSSKSSVNNPQLLPPRKRLNFITPEDDITVQSIPETSHQSSPTPKDDNKDVVGQSLSTKEENVESDSASRTIFAWKKLHEINILKGVLEYYTENGVYPFLNSSELRKFYSSWREKHGVPIDEDTFCDKMVDFRERFFLNWQIVRFTALGNQTSEEWMDPMEVEIYQMSYKIWGSTAQIWGPTARDNVNEDDGDHGKDLSSKAKQGGSSSS